MVALGTTFDARKIAPYEPAGAVWEGRVPVIITKTEIKPTAANDGQHFLALHVKALDAPYMGQENTIRLNLYNRSAQAVDIAQRQLSSICHVTGSMDVTDADQLMNKPFISVWIKGTRNITDQATGATRTIDNCECRDYTFADGRTIKEAMAGQAASNPYVPGQSGGPQSQAFGGAAPQAQPAVAPQTFAPGPAAAPAPQNGFAPSPAAAPQPQAGFAPPSGGFAPPAAQPGPGAAPGAGFAPPPPAQNGFAPPAQGQPGPGPWGGPQPGGAAPGGFGPR